MSVNVSASVVRILKETYKNNPELSAYKITTHKNKLSSYVEDPSLWVNLSSSGKPPDTTTEAVIHPDALQKRLELLKKGLASKPNLAQLTSNDKELKSLFDSFLGSDILSCVDITLRARVASSEEGLSPTLVGVVTELWTINEGWKGHATCHPLGGQSLQVSKGYLFDWRSPCVTDPQLGLYPLHIGDDISFQVVQSEQSVAPGTLLVTKYNTCLKDDFVTRYFEWISSFENNPLECLSKLLEWPAPWNCILAEEKLYYKYYVQILKVYDSCANAPEIDLLPRNKQQLMNTLHDSQFILNINNVLTKADGGQDRAKGEAKLLNVAVSLLCAVVKIKKNGCHLLSGPVKEVIKLLGTKKEIGLMQLLSFSVVDTHMVPIASALATPQTWHHVPTIPTNEELQKIIVETEESHKSLPEVKVTYSSAMEYGHTYFSLLRADCYYPLCEKIARLKVKKDDSYYELRFMEVITSSWKPVMFGLRFKGNIPQNSPEDTSCLKHGNLLCLSLGGKFEEDFIWATVECTDPQCHIIDMKGKRFKEGTVYICLCSEFNTLPDEECMEQLRRSRNVVAVKSPAYFRAYQPVLDALKELDLDHIHFLDTFLCPAANSKSVCNLLTSEVDPAPLFKPDKDDGLGKRPIDKMIADLKKADPLTLCLDPSQMDAIYQSLTTPVALIQGPPGTGKTHVGVKLLQLFLSLSSLPKDKPILIMAYRNGALNQFLKKCLEFCDKKYVIRVGGHSSDDYSELGELVLSNKIRSMETGGNTKLKCKLKSLSERIKVASNNVVKKSELSLENSREYITPEWLKSLLLKGSQSWLSTSMRASKRLKDNPEDCIKLLKNETVMGGGDSEDKDALSNALDLAWKEWTKDVTSMGAVQDRPTTTRETPVKESDDHNDIEDNGEDLESDREVVASDDDGDGIDEGRLMVDRWDTKHLDDAGIDDVSESDVWKLTADQKRKLIIKAVRNGYVAAIQDFKDFLRRYEETRKTYESAQCETMLRILRGAKIVGITTTRAAIHQRLLNLLKAPVVLVEEAAEVLEPNLLAALNPHVKHLILIGDHLQLKPKISCKRLEKKKFDKSMFQRLIEGGFPYKLLMHQCRMRPEMVSLYAHQYSRHKEERGGQIQSNTEIVSSMTSLSCMGSSVLWWSHDQPESNRQQGQLINNHEVKMVVSLSLWILYHGEQDKISKNDIVILTPYRSQLTALTKGLKDKASMLSRAQVQDTVTTSLSELKVHTVDEFQGHEAKVIILSLVRSNTKKKIGFLSDKCRQVVSVSRQKCGLYIIGDSMFFKDSSPLIWKPFIENREKEQVKDVLSVQWGVRPKTCKTPEELEKLVTGSLTRDVEVDSPVRETIPPIRQQSSPRSLSTVQITPTSPQGLVGEKPICGQGNEITDVSGDQLGEDDLVEVVEEVMDVASKWKPLGLALRVKSSVLETIYSDHRNNTTECLRDMLLAWLQQRYDTKKFGPPCWRMLCQAIFTPVGGNNPALARKIAEHHRCSAGVQ